MKKLTMYLLALTVCLTTVVLTNNLFAQDNTVVTGASRDNTLYQSTDGSRSNGSGVYLFAGKTNSGSIRRGLLSFDVSAVPAGSRIESVTLTLNMSKSIAGQEVLSLYRLLADWGEGASSGVLNEGGGGAAQTGDATWLFRFWGAESAWETPGGDFNPTSSASQTIGSTGKYTWESTPQLVSDVQMWLDNPGANFGWILKGDESTSGSTKRFDSRESATAGNRPVLTVVYLTPTNVEQDNGTKPGSFVLEQNSPNPFNPETTISYMVPSGQSGRITLNVYDVRGALIQKLVDGVVSPGAHSVVWNGTDSRGNRLSSGMYVYRLQAGSFSESNKMMLLR